MTSRIVPPFPGIAIAMAALLAGCTAIGRDDAQDTEQQLAAAGFDIKLADNPARRDHLATLPQHTLARFDRDGRPYYVYADPEWCKCMYVGNQADYDAYERLTAQEEIAEEKEEAAAMSEDAAMDWDLWGPWPYY
jgi:hypothetical protein